eukprot:PRCOL_00001006-RA
MPAPPGECVPMGDLVFSLDTAERQAAERGHTLRCELRILLLHGMLHLEGMDHELGEEEEREMAEEEQRYMAELGWDGTGLIEAIAAPLGGDVGTRAADRIKLLAIDMDGTLLDAQSKVRPAVAASLRAAKAAGVAIAIATGKARPAVERALAAAGLAGAHNVLSDDSPGIFLQGIIVHGSDGEVISESSLDAQVARVALEYASREGVPAVAFVDRERAATTSVHPRVKELHEVYWEPQAEVHGSVDELLAAYGSVHKVLLMADPADITGTIRPQIEALLGEQRATADAGGARAGSAGAQVVQAVADMLEITPAGVNKATALADLTASLGVSMSEVAAIGDGDNDLEMVHAAGLGIAMGNARPGVLAAADAVVASNDEEGVAEAIERFVLAREPAS